MTSPASRGQRLALMAIDNWHGNNKAEGLSSPKLIKKKTSPSKKCNARRRLLQQPADIPISDIERTLGLNNWDPGFVNGLIGESSERIANDVEQSRADQDPFRTDFLENVNELLDQPQPLTAVKCSTPYKSDDTSSFASLTPLIYDRFCNNIGAADDNNNLPLDETVLLQSTYSSADLLSAESDITPTDPSHAVASYLDLSEQHCSLSCIPEVTGETENISDLNASSCEQSFETPMPTGSSSGASASYPDYSEQSCSLNGIPEETSRETENISDPNEDGIFDATPEIQTVNTESDHSVGAGLPSGDHEDEDEGAHDDEMDELPLFGPNPKPKTQQQLKLENKERRDRGEEYKDSKGNLVPKKKPKIVECKCQFKLCKTLTEEETFKLNEAYWGLGNYSRQRDYINKCMKSTPVKRHSTGASKPRSNTYEYWFRVPRGEEQEDIDIRVCRAKFLGVLDIGKKTLVCTKQNEKNGFSKTDQRGKHAPSHKISPAQHSAIVEHISSFPKVESHYCRQSSSFEYLDQKLTIRLMHKLYKLGHDAKLHVGYETYRKIFKKDFHLSFHKPKKDQCSSCAIFNNLSDEQKSLRAEEHARHLKNKDLAQKEKDAHKQEALKNDSFKSFSFDLQSVLYTPCSEVSSFYYTRKLNCYNFTIYDQETRDGICYFWDETEGERGTCEIGTALWTHLLTLPENVKKVSFFSDCCGGQNRNRFIAALLLHAVRVLHFDQIDHCFLESGHTHMEVDSMHSCIEHAKKGKEVYCPSEWIPIFRSARGFSKSKTIPFTIKPYTVKVLTHDKMLDIKDLRSHIISSPLDRNTEGQAVSWLKIKWLRYIKENPESMFYKINYEDDKFMEMAAPFRKAATSSQKKRGRPKKGSPSQATCTSFNYDFLHPYPERLGISLKKKKDLLKLCKDFLIPEEFHDYYKNLRCNDEDTVERLAEPDALEEDEDGPALPPPQDCAASDD